MLIMCIELKGFFLVVLLGWVQFIQSLLLKWLFLVFLVSSHYLKLVPCIVKTVCFCAVLDDAHFLGHLAGLVAS